MIVVNFFACAIRADCARDDCPMESDPSKAALCIASGFSQHVSLFVRKGFDDLSVAINSPEPSSKLADRGVSPSPGAKLFKFRSRCFAAQAKFARELFCSGK